MEAGAHYCCLLLGRMPTGGGQIKPTLSLSQSRGKIPHKLEDREAFRTILMKFKMNLLRNVSDFSSQDGGKTISWETNCAELIKRWKRELVKMGAEEGAGGEEEGAGGARVGRRAQEGNHSLTSCMAAFG